MKPGPELDLCQKYIKRIKPNPNIIELVPKPLSSINNDYALLKPQLNNPYICLDETGKHLNSQEFSNIFKQFQLSGIKQLNFVIGGADGLHPDLRNNAHLSIAFGNLTWPHMLVRVMLLEQIYRAQQILCGHPYHRD